MRFTYVLIALGSVAGVISTFKGVIVRSSIDVVDDNAFNALNTRILQRMPKSKTNGSYELDENEWVPSANVRNSDKVSAVQLSGCTAVFFWDRDNIQSVYHILCGNEAVDGQSAVYDVSDSCSTIVAVTIAAGKQAYFDTMKSIIQAELYHLKDSDFTPMIYSTNALAPDTAYRFDSIAGTIGVTQTTEARINKQPQRF